VLSNIKANTRILTGISQDYIIWRKKSRMMHAKESHEQLSKAVDNSNNICKCVDI
jgi:hypothetical protein